MIAQSYMYCTMAQPSLLGGASEAGMPLMSCACDSEPDIPVCWVQHYCTQHSTIHYRSEESDSPAY